MEERLCDSTRARAGDKALGEEHLTLPLLILLFNRRLSRSGREEGGDEEEEGRAATHRVSLGGRGGGREVRP